MENVDLIKILWGKVGIVLMSETYWVAAVFVILYVIKATIITSV